MKEFNYYKRKSYPDPKICNLVVEHEQKSEDEDSYDLEDGPDAPLIGGDSSGADTDGEFPCLPERTSFRQTIGRQANF